MRFLFTMCLAATLHAGPLTLYSDLGTGSSVYGTNGSVVQGSGAGSWITQAWQFTVSGTGDFNLTQVDLGLTARGVGQITASLWTNLSSLPDVELGSWNLTVAEAAGQCCLLTTQSGITGITLTGGDRYWMVVGPRNSTDNIHIEWISNTVGATAPVLGSLNGGASWISDGVITNAAFDVLGTAAAQAPEPGTMAMLGLGAALLGLARLRTQKSRR